MNKLEKVPVIYSPGYELSFEGHVFPAEKYASLKERLVEKGLYRHEEFLTPQPAELDDLLLVHKQSYLDDLRNLSWSYRTITSELPMNKQIVDFFIMTAGGTSLAARKAVEAGAAFHIGGGFHHAFAGHAEGFCFINDIAVAIRKAKQEKIAEKFLVFDCDLHQGNGTACIFKDDADVFTFSIHQENLYPRKEKSDLDVGLSDFTADEEYLSNLKKAIEQIFTGRKFDLVVYVAGADPFAGDKLGTLQVSKEALAERDRMLFEACRKSGSNVAVVLAGGYAENTNDVVDIHENTLMELKRIYEE
jgi:acetoin utilization deacetylase AcuC-like enzyme